MNFPAISTPITRFPTPPPPPKPLSPNANANANANAIQSSPILSNPNHNFLKKKHLLLDRRSRGSRDDKSSSSDETALWTASIARRCRNGALFEAVEEFSIMRLTGVEPNHITFLTLLTGCADFPSDSTLRFGASIHGYIWKLGINKHIVSLGTAVVSMYFKCGCVELARQAFDEMSEKNAFSWNTMIDGYMRNGDIEAAIEVFDQMPERDKFSWTALIGGFVKKGHFQEALERFREMQLSGVEPDYVTIIGVLTACADMGTLGLGIWIHLYALKRGLSDNVRVRNSLVDMYSRCGCIDFARQEFNKMTTRTQVSWNCIIVGFAINGHAQDALDHFSLMQKEGFKPNGVSFTGVLTACSHAGLVDKGLEFYNTMRKTHRISPRIEHYGCMVDLLGRAGRLEDALRVIQSMPMKPNEVVLGSLLAACKAPMDIDLAERLMAYLVELKPDIDSNYVLLSNLYAGFGRWDGVGKVRRKMKALGIKKKPGISAVEIDCSVHEFVSGDKSHVHSDQIYFMLNQLSVELRLCGYVPETIAVDVLETD